VNTHLSALLFLDLRQGIGHVQRREDTDGPIRARIDDDLRVSARVAGRAEDLLVRVNVVVNVDLLRSMRAKSSPRVGGYASGVRRTAPAGNYASGSVR
jgi:hypothetical protein